MKNPAKRLSDTFSNRLTAVLPGWALPFVTRSLRGGRGARMVALSILATLAVVICGPWLALGDGDFSHESRVAMGFEESRWLRERAEHKVITHDSWSGHSAERAAARANEIRNSNPDAYALAVHSGIQPDEEWNPVLESAARAWEDVRMAASSVAERPADQKLRERARAMLREGEGSDVTFSLQEHGFAWWNEHEVRRLQSILDHGELPRLERYASPLGFDGAVRMTGALASLLLSLLFFVVAPVMAAVQQAQEAHENTLMPLIGTSLSPRALTVGLLVGATIAPMVIAIPLLGILMLTGFTTGAALPTLAFIIALVAGGVFGSAIGQLVGQFLGRRRTPGAVAVSFLGLTGIAWMVGLGIGFEMADEPAHALAIAPQAAAAWLIAQAFGSTPEGWTEAGGPSFVHLTFQAMAAVVLGWLAVRAVSRRIALTEGATLTRSEAGLGISVAIAMVCVAGSEVLNELPDREALAFYFATLLPLGAATLVFAMARVPLRDAPPSMVRVPLLAIAGEVFAAAGLHLLVVSIVAGPGALDGLVTHPGAMVHWVWGWSVISLLAVRMAVLPPRGVVHSVALALCVVGVGLAFGNAIGLCVDQGLAFLMMTDAGVFPGLMQIVAILGIPAWLASTLSQRLGGLHE